MKLNNSNLILGLGLVLALGACEAQKGNSDAYQTSSDNCSQQFVSDINDLYSDIRNIKNDRELELARKDAKDFKKLYAGVSCEAIITSDGESETRHFEVDKELRTIIEALEAAQASLETGYIEGSSDCSPTLIKAYNRVLTQARKTDGTEEELRLLRRMARHLKKTYPDVVCRAKAQDQSNDTKWININKEMNDLISIVNGVIEDDDVRPEAPTSFPDSLETLQEDISAGASRV